jgi:hypothetical protein
MENTCTKAFGGCTTLHPARKGATQMMDIFLYLVSAIFFTLILPGKYKPIAAVLWLGFIFVLVFLD